MSGRQPASGLEPRPCATCGTEFQPYRDTQRTCSKVCYKALPESKEIQRRSDRRPERQQRKNDLRRGSQAVREYNRKKQLERYGINPELHDEMLLAQDGLCALCGSPPDPSGVRAASRLHVDHDHLTGKVRTLLCLNCNHGLGCFKDDPALLRAAADYIELHRQG